MNTQEFKDKFLRFFKNLDSSLKLTFFFFAIIVLIVLSIRINREQPKTQEQLQNEKYPHIAKFVEHFYQNSKWEIEDTIYYDNEYEISTDSRVFIKIEYFGCRLRRELQIDENGLILAVVNRDYHDFDIYGELDNKE